MLNLSLNEPKLIAKYRGKNKDCKNCKDCKNKSKDKLTKILTEPEPKII